MKRIFSGLLILSLLLALTVPAAAANDATGTTLRLEEANGAVTVKDAAGKDKTARTGMRLYNGYTIATGASSSAYISLDETKAVKLDASGKVEIRQSGKKLEVSLTAGQLYFNVTQPLKTDESLNIRTSTMVTGIRGSFGWVNLTQMGLMHGHVTLTCTNPETGESRVTEIYTGEKVSYEQAVGEAADPALAEIDFVKEEIVLEDVPATVVEEIVKDETLQEQLAGDESVTIDVTELIESLPEKQAEEKAAEAAAREAVEAAVAAQEETIAAAAAEEQAKGDATATGGSAEQVFAAAATDAGGDDNSSSAPVVTSVSVAGDGGDVSAALSDALSNNSSVTFTGSGSAASLTIPSGKTLTVAEDANLTLSGTSSNLSSNTLINNGTLTISGTFHNGGATAGRFVNNGTLTINSGASFVNEANGTFSGSTSFTGGGKLTFAVTLNANGGTYDTTYIAPASYDCGVGAALPTATQITKGTDAFGGWYENETFSGSPVTTITETDTGNKTYYAKWTATSSGGSGTSGILYVQSVDGANNTVRGQIDGGAAADYTVEEPSVFSAFSSSNLYLVYYSSGAITAVDPGASPKNSIVDDPYSSGDTLKAGGINYNIAGAHFYNIARTSADAVGTVSSVSALPILSTGATVYIVTAADGGTTATAVYYVTVTQS